MVFEVLAVESEDGLLVATDEKARRHIPAELALNLALTLFWEMLFYIPARLALNLGLKF